MSDTFLDAWCKGYRAARDRAEAGNPYPPHTDLAAVWARARQKSLAAAAEGLPAPPLALRHSQPRR